jgi:Domain of unknown function (DUF222)
VLDKLATMAFDALTPVQTLEVLARREVQARRQPAIDHRLINRLVADGVPLELGATNLPKVLAQRLKISSADAHQRLDDAADLGPRKSLTGEPLEPTLPAVAAAQAQGHLGADHLKTVRWFFANLPDSVDLVPRSMPDNIWHNWRPTSRPSTSAKPPNGYSPRSTRTARSPNGTIAAGAG